MVVLTGGPGSGKTSLANSLQQHDFRVAKESGRTVLKNEGGIALREINSEAYALAMLDLDKQNFMSSIATQKPMVFDRGFPDIAGYLDLMNIEIPKPLDHVCMTYRYTGPIFALPPWAQIYRNDEERIQNFEQAGATYEAVCSAWRKYGYNLIELPKASVQERTDFVLNNLD